MEDARRAFSSIPGSEGIRLVSSCPFCSTHYDFLDAKVIDVHGDSHLLYVQCAKCFSAVVLLILTGEIGVSSMGLVTDLTSDDVLRFKRGNRVSSDDVLVLHTAIRSKSFLRPITIDGMLE